jgi:acetyl esterase
MEVGLEWLIGEELAPYIEESREFSAALEANTTGQSQPDLRTPEGLQEARDTLNTSRTHRDPAAVERLAEVGARNVPVRIITPSQGEARAVYLNIHGGGFYMDSAARGDARNRRLADALGVAVVSVDYRLAPEHPWPAAPDDCETAAIWLLDEAETHFGTARLLMGGTSAGATLAMTTLLRLRDRGFRERLVGVVLLFGSYDLSGQTPAGRALNGQFFIDAYVGHVVDRTDPDISPLFGDLRGLPPALLIVGTLDIVFEQSLAMAARLSAAGGQVDIRVYPESSHGFTSLPTAMGAAAVRDIESWMADRLVAE